MGTIHKIPTIFRCASGTLNCIRCAAMRRIDATDAAIARTPVLTWGICTRRAGKLNRARSQLYRSQILQENVRWKKGRNPYIVQETNVGKTTTKMTATIDFAMQFKKLHESGMEVSNICGCLEFHPSCIPAFLRASSICVVRLPSRKKSGESS